MNLVKTYKIRRSLILVFIGVSMSLGAFAQAEIEELPEKENKGELRTLFKPGRRQGFYGAFSTGYSQIDKVDALTFSARGTWLLAPSLGIGFGGTGFMNNMAHVWNYSNPPYSADDYSLVGGYGGLLIEPILLPNWPVHLSFPVMLGIGVASTFDQLYYQAYYQTDDVFLIAEPHVELEFNLTRFARFALYGSYRFTSDLRIENVSPDALKGYSAGFILKFGLF